MAGSGTSRSAPSGCAPRYFLPEHLHRQQRSDGNHVKQRHTLQQRLIVEQAHDEHQCHPAQDPVHLLDVYADELGARGLRCRFPPRQARKSAARVPAGPNRNRGRKRNGSRLSPGNEQRPRWRRWRAGWSLGVFLLAVRSLGRLVAGMLRTACAGWRSCASRSGCAISVCDSVACSRLLGRACRLLDIPAQRPPASTLPLASAR